MYSKDILKQILVCFVFSSMYIRCNGFVFEDIIISIVDNFLKYDYNETNSCKTWDATFTVDKMVLGSHLDALTSDDFCTEVHKVFHNKTKNLCIDIEKHTEVKNYVPENKKPEITSEKTDLKDVKEDVKSEKSSSEQVIYANQGKTATIVSCTLAGVVSSTVLLHFVSKWVTTYRQSGTFRVPECNGVEIGNSKL